MFFNLCIKLLSSHLYMDDIYLCLSLPEDPREAVEITNCLGAVLRGMRASKWKLNPSPQMEVIVLEEGLDPEIRISSVLDGIALLLKEQICSLGVLLDLGFLLDEEVAVMARSAFKQFSR